MAATEIEWTAQPGFVGASWNVLRGCSRVSPGCGDGKGGGCYAERQAHRFSGPGGPYEGLTRLTSRGPRWTGEVRFVAEKLEDPVRTRRPTCWFVNSMSDLFHERVTNEQIAAVFGIMGGTRRHRYLILTKRPERMREWFEWVKSEADGMEYGLLHDACGQLAHVIDPGDHDIDAAPTRFDEAMESLMGVEWPLPNVWIGVSVEDQQRANERVPLLLQCPAAVRFVSAEPLLGPIDFERVPLPDGYLSWAGVTGVLQPIAEKNTEPDDYRYFARQALKLDWVIVGGESGPGARPCDIAWIESIVEQCRGAGVKAFVKQLGARPYMQRLPEWHEHEGSGSWSVPLTIAEGRYSMRLKDKKGENIDEFPPWLRVRGFPEVLRG